MTIGNYVEREHEFLCHVPKASTISLGQTRSFLIGGNFKLKILVCLFLNYFWILVTICAINRMHQMSHVWKFICYYIELIPLFFLLIYHNWINVYFSVRIANIFTLLLPFFCFLFFLFLLHSRYGLVIGLYVYICVYL